MAFFIDTPKQLDPATVRCSKCRAFLDSRKLEACSNCKSLICSKCGHCHCDNKAREVTYALRQDYWPGETE